MSKSTLEEIISTYKNKLADKKDNINPELEIRFKNVNFTNFSIIYNYLLTNTKPEDVTLTQVLSSSIKQRSRQNALQTNYIRNIYYKNKESVKEHEYCSKSQIVVPYGDITSFGLYFIVALSLEENPIMKFNTDESVIFRLKNRVSFIIIEDNIKWRIDMTVVKQLSGSEKNIQDMLKKIVNQMFKSADVRPDNLLLLFNDSKTSQKLYTYEIEAELLNNKNITSNDILNLAKKILHIANPEYLTEATLQSKIYEVAKVLIKTPGILHNYQNKLGLKQLLPKAQALTRYDYRNIYPLAGYYITDKADGYRAIGLYSTDNTGYIISDVLYTYKTIKQDSYKQTIVDGELINTKLYIFDAIMVDGMDISQLPFESRILSLNLAESILKTAGLDVEVKPYLFISDSIEKQVKEMYYRKNRPYEIDGLIFVKPGDSYSNTKNYKWKKIEDNTIDFLVKKAPQSVFGKKPFIEKPKHTLYLLFVGISHNIFQALGLHVCPGYSDIFEDNKLISNNTYFPIQFSPSNAPYAYLYYHPDSNNMEINDTICEFRCINNCTASNGPLIIWELIRIRKDRQKDLESKKYFGNDYKIAEITWINYLDQFPLEQLWLNLSSNDYFSSNKSGIYHAQTSVLSFIKTNRIMSYKYKNWIIDVGSGKGQDLGRYFNANIKNLIAIDNDKASLSELIRRKYTFAQDSKQKVSTNVYVILTDMTTFYENILNKIYDSTHIEPNTINCIICNLSIHYYIYSPEYLINFIQFVIHMLKPNGYLVITCFFGELIFEQLKSISEGQSWTIYEGEIIKYSIKKMYSSDKLEKYGQKIGVILPFSNNQYYEEYLVNTDYLINEFSKFKLHLRSKTNVSNIINDFKTRNPSVAANLTKDDEKYLSLYGELVFQFG